MRRPLVTTACFCLTVGLAATAAHACGVSTPDRYSMYPGMTLIRPDMVVLLPILSGALERPFYALAGYRDLTTTLAFSIQANLLAMLAGVAATIVGIFAFSSNLHGVSESAILGLAFVGIPAIGALVKYAWFARVPRDPTPRARGPIFALATLVSTITMASVPFWMHLFGTDTYRYADGIASLQPFAILFVCLASLVTHLFVCSRFSRQARPRIEARGFEVLPVVPAAAARADAPPGQPSAGLAAS